MLFYIRCPSCGRILSYELDKYHEDIKAILNDPGLNKTEKEAAGAKLLNKYGYKHLCCRPRIMGLIPYHEIIQS
jgi:DNA-directed RNA polymerase subunit N (RpoN/RPB10)